MSTMLIDSLTNRVRVMNEFWQQIAADMTLAQVNHQERPGVLPIAFSFSHYIRMQDQTVSGFFFKQPPLWARGEWAGRVGVSVDKVGREESVAEMEQIRFADFDAWRAYQTEVFAQTDTVLRRVDEAELAEVIIPKLPPNMERIWCARVVGPGRAIRKLEAFECFIYQHGLRHLGEIEYARSLVGLGGLTS